MRNIRFTLLKGLFSDPPPYMGDLLAENADRVFPGKDDFIRFLEETDNQKRTKCATSLVMRLSRESGLFIPTRLLVSLLEAEEQYAPNTASDTYVPQDHFTHLIHLYLLGIYIFTHHKKFNRKLCHYFERRRQEYLNACSLNSDEAAFGDFIFSWRAFVLLHDIAYPHELPPLAGNGLLSEIRNRYSSFQDEVADETAISFLSRMAAWDLADESFPQTKLNQVFSTLVDKLSEEEDRTLFSERNNDNRKYDLKSWQDSIRLPMLHGRRFLTLLKNVSPKERILAVLIHSRSGKVSLALMPSNSGSHRLINLDGKFNLPISELTRYAFDLGTTPRLSSQEAEYEWQMFVLNYQKAKERFTKQLSEIINRNLTTDLISSVSKLLALESPSTIATITSDSDFREYDYFTHEKLQLWLHGIRRGTKNESTDEFNIVSSIALSLEQNIATRISQIIKRQIEENLPNSDSGAPQKVLADGIEAIVKHALSPILTNKKLVKNVAAILKDEMQSKIENELSRRNLIEDLRRVARLLVPDTQPDLTYTAHEFDWKEIISTVEHEEKLLNELLKKSSLPPLRDLFKKYKPDYLQSSCLDHGLASSLCVLQISKALSKFAKALEDSSNTPSDGKASALARFASIAICLGDETSKDDFSYRISILLPEIARAVAVHNLYPKDLSNLKCSQFRINLAREPFCFFAMLVDSLQCWDRDRRLWHSKTSMPYKTLGDNYDISIKGDVIHVYEHDHGLDIGKRADAIKNGLNSFMNGASDFIWLDLGQWKDGMSGL